MYLRISCLLFVISFSQSDVQGTREYGYSSQTTCATSYQRKAKRPCRLVPGCPCKDEKHTTVRRKAPKSTPKTNSPSLSFGKKIKKFFKCR